MMKRWFFTYGTDENYPFQNGYTEVWAQNMEDAIHVFRREHPDLQEGILNCAEVYNQTKFAARFQPAAEGKMSEGGRANRRELLYSHREEDVLAFLEQGISPAQIFRFAPSEEAEIFKTKDFRTPDEIVYVAMLPYIDIHQPLQHSEVMFEDGLKYMRDRMYSWSDFLFLAKDNERLADDLLSFVSGESPLSAIQTHYEKLSDEEMMSVCGQTLAEVFGWNKEEFWQKDIAAKKADIDAFYSYNTPDTGGMKL